MGSTNGPSRSRATGNTKTGAVKPNGSTRSPSRGKK